jgi:uncharacterized iron-regulated membrane protein
MVFRPRVRAVLLWIHLALGLSAALPILVLCITGALLAYQLQIVAWLDHRGIESHPSATGSPALTVEQLIAITRKNRGVNPESVTIFRDPARPVEIEIKAIPGPVYLDAYSGSVIGGPSRKARQFFQKIAAWHVFLGVTGSHRSQFRAVVRAVNAAALLSLILGICLWLPRRWTWPHLRAVALPRWGVPGRARDFNWHNTIGIWSAIPLLVIVWTAMAMSYNWASRLTNWNSSLSAAATQGTQNAEPKKTQPANLDALFSRATQQDPHWKAITIFMPHQDSDAVHFAIQMKNYIGIGTVAGLMLDRSGNALYFTPAGAAGISPATFIRFGHTGEAWGFAGQTIAALASLGGAILVWTGLALSLRRWKTARSRKRNRVHIDFTQ